jgi:uncharacterized protein YdeI (BOF family)
MAADLAKGKQVRVVGRVEIYQGDTEIQIDWDPEQVQIIGEGTTPDPLSLSTNEAALEENEGWLVGVGGPVVTKLNDYEMLVDDGSGPVRVFIDGYNGSFAGVGWGSWAQIVGLASEDGEGSRIRVRGSEDVAARAPFYLPLIMRNG